MRSHKTYAVVQFTESDWICPNLTIFYRILPTEVISKMSYTMPICDGYVDFLLSVNLCTFYEFHVCYNIVTRQLNVYDFTLL